MSIVPTGAVLNVLQTRIQQRPQRGGQLLVLANPEIPKEYVQLDGAQEEAARIERVFAGDSRWTLQVLSERQVTKAAFTLHAGSADWLHVAAHALAEPDEHTAYILLSNARGGVECLHSSEIQRMRLRAQLVFLSACSTTLGKHSLGEGLMSLARAFLFAGCSCVIASTWPVGDEDTPSLVESFYRALKDGQSPEQALQSAKQVHSRMVQRPRSWAAFQVLGDGSTLKQRHNVKLLLAGDHHEAE